MAKVKGSRASDSHAFVKDRCVGCNRVVYAYLQINIPRPEPMCESCLGVPWKAEEG